MGTFSLLVYVAFLAAVAISTLYRPAMAVAGILCTFGLEQWAQAADPYFAVHDQLTNFATSGILLLGLLMQMRRGRRVFALPPVGLVVTALYLFSFASVLWSYAPSLTLQLWSVSWPYLVTVTLLTPMLITCKDDAEDAIVGLMAFGSIVLLLLLFTVSWEGRFIMIPVHHAGIIETMEGNPLAVASLAGYVTLSALFWQPEGRSPVFRVLRWAVVVLGLAASVRSGSRGQSFAILGAAFVFLPVFRKSGKGGLSSMVAATAALGLASVVAFTAFAAGDRWESDRFVEDYSGTRTVPATRLFDIWSAGDTETLALGLGNSAAIHPAILGDYPHLVALEVLGEEGAIGFALFVAILAMSARSVFRMVRQSTTRSELGVAACVGSILLFDFLLSFKQGSLLGSSQLFGSAIIVGRYAERCGLRMENREPSKVSAFLGSGCVAEPVSR